MLESQKDQCVGAEKDVPVSQLLKAANSHFYCFFIVTFRSSLD